MKRLLLSLFLGACSMLRADSFTLDLLPSGGSITGTAGSTIGWGYSITNQSTNYWLVLTSLNSAPFVHATPLVLFDYPILAPGASITQAYDRILGLGLMELAISHSITSQVINTGNFVLTAEFWSGDPFAGDSFVMDANSVSRSYQATAKAVPEPSTAFVILGAAILCAGGVRKRRQSRG